jgi:hypothetical protein
MKYKQRKLMFLIILITLFKLTNIRSNFVSCALWIKNQKRQQIKEKFD